VCLWPQRSDEEARLGEKLKHSVAPCASRGLGGLAADRGARPRPLSGEHG
jgi:hypothetical protein